MGDSTGLGDWLLEFFGGLLDGSLIISILKIIPELFNVVFEWVVDFILNVIFLLPTMKAEEQGNFILKHLYGVFSRFDYENFISFFVGFIFFIFCFKIALKIISIIRG